MYFPIKGIRTNDNSSSSCCKLSCHSNSASSIDSVDVLASSSSENEDRAESLEGVAGCSTREDWLKERSERCDDA